jgi:hypothetical protein
MPFPITDILLDSPDVRIFFDGLLILSPAEQDGRTICEIELVKPHMSHKLTVEVYLADQGDPRVPIARLVGPLSSQLEITVDQPSGVEAFISPGHTASLDSALDLKRLHPTASLKCQGHKISLDEGQLTGALPVPSPVSRKHLDGTCEDVDPFATIVAASIELGNRQLSLRLAAESCSLAPENGEKKYVIYVRHSRQVALGPASPKSDFGHYYDAVNDVVMGDRWDYFLESCNALRAENTARIPCMSVLFDGI